MIYLYNTLTKQKELFKALHPPKVGLYTCGPTVYGPGHLGHARSYITFDILKRALKFNGFSVKHVLNITDVHDDMIKEAHRRSVSIFKLADEYILQFHHDLQELNITPADFYPRVTEVIPEIIEMVKTLLDRGCAYAVNDGPACRQAGSVYYQVSKFKNYGQLSGIKLGDAVSGTRVETDKYERESPADFALWKAQKPGEPFWDSPWGKGRPGWHIECSVMAKKFLGETLDIHAGAMDLKFPHHENEIAQSEAANGVKFANFWIHAGLLDIEGQKMSKSLGNIFSLQEIKDRGFTPSAFRYLTLTTHYRSRLNFTWEGLAAAQNGLRKLRLIVSAWGDGDSEAREGKELSSDKEELSSGEFARFSSPAPSSAFQERFLSAVSDDLNMPQALSVVWDLVKSDLPEADKYRTVIKFDEVLGLKLDLVARQKVEVPDGVKKLVEERGQLRQKGDFEAADRARQKILEAGYTVEDTPQGPKIASSN